MDGLPLGVFLECDTKFTKTVIAIGAVGHVPYRSRTDECSPQVPFSARAQFYVKAV